jgi:hypothetical protein
VRSRSGAVARLGGGLGLSALVALAAPAASAADWEFEARTGLEFQGDTDLDVGGEFDSWLWSLGASAGAEIAQDLHLGIDGDYQLIGYDFSGVFPDPWEDVNLFDLSPMFRVRLSDELSLLAGPNVMVSAETGADFGDSLGIEGRAGIGYQFADNLQLTLGVVAGSEIEDDVAVLPLVLVDWEPVEDLRFEAEFASIRGGGASLGYTFLEHFTVGVGGEFRHRRFRLDDDGPGFTRDGVGEDEATAISGQLRLEFDRVALESYVGAIVDGEFKVDDRHGHRLGKSDYDDAVYGGIRLRVGF